MMPAYDPAPPEADDREYDELSREEKIVRLMDTFTLAELAEMYVDVAG